MVARWTSSYVSRVQAFLRLRRKWSNCGRASGSLEYRSEPMRLSEFIKANREQIIREWEGCAKTLSGGEGLPSWVLRDHAEAIVKYIAENMEQRQFTSEEIAKAQGEGP